MFLRAIWQNRPCVVPECFQQSQRFPQPPLLAAVKSQRVRSSDYTTAPCAGPKSVVKPSQVEDISRLEGGWPLQAVSAAQSGPWPLALAVPSQL